jgi:hypothetical protein
MMEHEQAMKTNAAERYLLGELTETEADSFEDHFFDCRVCAEDIRQGVRMLDAGRAVVKDEKRGPEVVQLDSRRKRRSWIPAAVAAMLLIGIGLPALIQWRRSPQKLGVATLYLSGTARGAADENVVTLGDKKLLLRVDVPSTQPFPRYVLTVGYERGKAIASEEVAAADTEEPVLLLLSELPAGSYEVVIEGVREDGKRSKVTTRSFRVLRK